MPWLADPVKNKTDALLQYLYHDDAPVVGAPFTATLADGSVRKGIWTVQDICTWKTYLMVRYMLSLVRIFADINEKTAPITTSLSAHP
jgi:hypothetical protein